MGNQRLWMGFLIIVIGLGCYFCAKAGIQVYQYVSLDSRTPALVSRWEVESLGKDRYGLDATYSYEVQGERLEQTCLLPKKEFRNRFAAEKGAIQAAAGQWYAWYSSKNPDLSRLEKVFPFKSCLYAAFVVIALAYLIVIVSRVMRQESDVIT